MLKLVILLIQSIHDRQTINTFEKEFWKILPSWLEEPRIQENNIFTSVIKTLREAGTPDIQIAPFIRYIIEMEIFMKMHSDFQVFEV